MAQEEYLILHNMVVALYWAIHNGQVSDLEHVEAQLKFAIEKSAGITLEKAEELVGLPPGLGC